MIDLMIVAVLSGTRTAGGANYEAEPVHAPIRQAVSAGKQMTSDRDWLPPSFMFEEERACPIFLNKEVKGFGTLRVGSLCNTRPEQ